MKIYKTYTIPIKSNKEDIDYLFSCNKESARVWNECVILSKELWKTQQEYSDRDYLQTKLKGFSHILPAKAIQIVIKKYLTSIVGIQKARKVGRTDLKYPWRFKNNYNTTWDSMMFKCDYNYNYIYLSKPKIHNKEKDKMVLQKAIKIKVKNLPKNVVYTEVKYDNGLKLAINYWIDSENIEQIESGNVSAIDLGEIHTITSFDILGNSQIITGRRLRSFQRFRNKELGQLNRKLSRCSKGSRNYKKYRKAIRKLTSKTNIKITNELHKTSKLYKDYCLTNKIKIVIVGDLNNFNINLKNKIRKKGTKQKLVQWNHGQLITMLTYKLARHDIKVVEMSEAYTSQTCPCCSNKYKPKSRNYICKCGFTMHRDLVGAYNILSKHLNDGIIKPLDIEVKPIKYLRIA